jgi:hypothetical protein
VLIRGASLRRHPSSQRRSAPKNHGYAGLDERVVRVAEAALARYHAVSSIDLLLGLGWLAPSQVDAWRQGRVPNLESEIDAGLEKVTRAMQAFRSWAVERGLRPSETAYVSRTPDRRPLRFSEGGDPAIELAYRTHWLAPEFSERKRGQLAERASRPPDLVVVEPLRDWTCAGCGGTGGTGGLLIMDAVGPLCLTCADLDHLIYLPRGDAALTRRAKAASRLSAVVVRFSRARKRYERQGVLVEEAALEEAERQCLADEEARARRRERDEERRQAADADLQDAIAAEIRRQFPRCAPERATAIARHTATRGSGRIGRTAAAAALDPQAIELAVAASIRHLDTSYDELLMAGLDRAEAREHVASKVARILEGWRGPT